MGTKNDPGKYDCYEKAEPDEPMFILLARDPMAPILVELWASLRQQAAGNPSKVAEARQCAAQMQMWKAEQDMSHTHKIEAADPPPLPKPTPENLDPNNVA